MTRARNLEPWGLSCSPRWYVCVCLCVPCVCVCVRACIRTAGAHQRCALQDSEEEREEQMMLSALAGMIRVDSRGDSASSECPICLESVSGHAEVLQCSRPCSSGPFHRSCCVSASLFLDKCPACEAALGMLAWSCLQWSRAPCTVHNISECQNIPVRVAQDQQLPPLCN